MADNPQRTLLIKGLENTKLRQRIKDLEVELCQRESKHIEEVSSLTKQNDALRKQNENDSKIKQLQLNNKKLMEDLVEAKKAQCKAEEEIVLEGEKNSQLTYDLNNIQQENEKCKTAIEKISLESARKEHDLQMASQELMKFKQQNSKLQKELEHVSTDFQQTIVKLRKKESDIMQLSNCLKESTESMLQQGALEETIQKLQAEKSNLQLEIQETDTNRSKMAEILLKNKELVAVTKKLQAEFDKLLGDNSGLENQLIDAKENIEKLTNTLETAQRENLELKERNEKIQSELREFSLELKGKEEIINQKCKLEEQNRLVKKQAETNAEEIGKYKQSMVLLAEERCELKQRIEDLQQSNFQKLKIIAKLKECSSQDVSSS